MSPVPWTETRTGLRLAVRVTPRGGADRIDGAGIRDDGKAVLNVRVRAAPEDGAANDAVRALLADRLGLPARDIRLAAGATARLKLFDLAGDARLLAERARTLFAKAQP